jgi:hypothetical protein
MQITKFLKFLLFWQNIGTKYTIAQKYRIYRNIGRISEHSTNSLNLLFSENSVLSRVAESSSYVPPREEEIFWKIALTGEISENCHTQGATLSSS